MEIPALLSNEAGQSAGRLVDEMSRLCYLSRAIHVAAELDVSDHLGDEPLTADALADRIGADGPALGRLLQFLSAYGIFQRMPDGRFSHSPLSSVLRGDHPESKRAAIRRWQPFWWAAIGELDHAVRTGGAAFEKVHGVPFFQYIGQSAEAQSRFDDGMAQISRADDAAVAAAYDFTQFDRIVDVGGGQGGLLAQILLAAPESSGVLFDQPQVVSQATRLEENGVAARADRIGGNFFDSVPAGGDCYVIKGVLHDFNDDECVTILSNIREALRPGGHVIVANQDFPSPIDGPHPNLTMDIQMMTVLNGRERSQADWSALIQRAGLKLIGSHRTESLFTLTDGIRG